MLKGTKKKTAKKRIVKRRNPEPGSEINDLKLLNGEIVKIEFSKGGADWQIGGKLSCWYNKNGKFEYYGIKINNADNDDGWGSIYFTDRDIRSAVNAYLTINSTLPTVQLK